MSAELLRRAAYGMRLNGSFGATPDPFPHAVADWLDRVATALENGDPDLSLGEPSDARAVARAYLSEGAAS